MRSKWSCDLDHSPDQLRFYGKARLSAEQRFDVDMSFKCIRQSIDQALAVFGVVLHEGCKVCQPFPAAELVQPEPTPASVVQQAMQIGADHASVVLLAHPADLR